MKNSMQQANEKYEGWKDNRDIDKAFYEWAEKNWSPVESMTQSMTMEIMKNVKAFAMFYAQRCGIENSGNLQRIEN